MAGRAARRQRAVHGKLVRAMTRLLERVESLRRRKCPRYIHPSRAEEDSRTLNGERDHVFIGNQREQLQKEPAQEHVSLCGTALRYCTPVCPHQRGRVRLVLRQVSGPFTV